MQDGSEANEAAARLEAALDRIAAAASRLRASPLPVVDAVDGVPHDLAPAMPGGDEQVRVVGARLDALIAELRTALGGPAPFSATRGGEDGEPGSSPE